MRWLKLAGFAAATVFLIVSGLANLRFGMSIGELVPKVGDVLVQAAAI